ncbi:MAG: DUF72 domain-containing protein [Anaerolineales bacterium]|nr:DUF72 domain-containing protein [Anaerolineales bacterium]
MIRMGTSGFSYEDWVGPVYPEGLPKGQWLGYYAEHFDTVELNVSYYRIPSQKIAEGWVERTPDHFLFTLKAHQSITHEREHPEFEAFLSTVAPISEAGKLACILAQFPYSFHASDVNRDYLLRLREGFALMPVVVEFRDHGWVSEETFELLEQLGLGFCSVDEPPIKGLMPPVARATSDVAYVRFHGRNAAKWWQHDHAWERYDYTYREDELSEWVPRIRALDQAAHLTLVYANNHYHGQSVDTLRKLESLLADGI